MINLALDKLKFWKKREEGFDDLPEDGGSPFKSSVSPQEEEMGMPKIEPTMPKFASFEQKEEKERGTGDIQKDVQLILSKLDTIKAIVDSLDHRLARIEKIAEGRE